MRVAALRRALSRREVTHLWARRWRWFPSDAPGGAVARVRRGFLVFVAAAACFVSVPALVDARNLTDDPLGPLAAAALVAAVVYRARRRRIQPVLWALELTALAASAASPHNATPASLIFLCALLDATYTTRRTIVALPIGYAGVVAAMSWRHHLHPSVYVGTIVLAATLATGMHALTATLRNVDEAHSRRADLADATTALAAAVDVEDVYQVFLAGISWLLGTGAFARIALHWLGNEAAMRADGVRVLVPADDDVAANTIDLRIPVIVGVNDRATIEIQAVRKIPENLLADVHSLGMAAVLRLAAIAESDRFRRLVERSFDRITVASADLTVRFQSGGRRESTDVVEHGALGQPLCDIVHPDDFARLEAALHSIDHGQATTTQLRWKIGGGWRECETVIANQLAEPSVQGYVLNTRDVTDRNRLELELRHAQKLESVGRLAAGIAHEINTPIQFIGDNLRFLADAFQALDAVGAAAAEASPDDTLAFYRQEVPDAIRQSMEGIERVATIVSAMKAFGHLDQTNQTRADLVAALRNTVVVARSETKHVADVILDADDIPQVVCYVSDLNQVFLNLIINAAHAIEARPDGKRGTILVRAAARGADEIAISVSDDGCGIPKELRDKIFEPFFTTKDVGKGTGQGLALARSIVVDRHRGRIDVDSELGKGTTFTVVLPLFGLDGASTAIAS